MRSHATMLGTPRTSTSSSSVSGRTPWNHVFHVASASWARIACAPRSQMSAAAVSARSRLSTGTSTDVENGGRSRGTPPVVGRPVVRGGAPAGKCAVVAAGSKGERGTYHRPPKLDKAGASPPRGEAFRRGVWVPVRLHGFSFFARFPTSNRAPLEAMREAHVPAQQPETQEDARVPAPDAHSGGSRGAEGTAEPRPQAPLRLIWRVRDRATFDALAR